MCQDIIDFSELLIKYEHSSKLIPINFGKLIKRTNVSIPKGFDEEIFNNDLFFKLERMEVIDLGSVINIIIDLFELYNKSETVKQESETVKQESVDKEESVLKQESVDKEESVLKQDTVNQDETVKQESVELFKDIPVPSFNYINNDTIDNDQDTIDNNQDETVKQESAELFNIPSPSFDNIVNQAKIKLNNKTNLVPVKPLLANKIKNFKKKGNESIIPCTEPYDDSCCTQFVEYNGEKYYYDPKLFKKVIGSKTHVLEKI